jgi:hypothetical protein
MHSKGLIVSTDSSQWWAAYVWRCLESASMTVLLPPQRLMLAAASAAAVGAAVAECPASR